MQPNTQSNLLSNNQSPSQVSNAPTPQLVNGMYNIKDNQTGKTFSVAPQDLGQYGLQVPNNAGAVNNPLLRNILGAAATAAPTVLGIGGAIGGGALAGASTDGLGTLAGGAAMGGAGQAAGTAIQKWIDQSLLGNSNEDLGSDASDIAKGGAQGAIFGVGGAALKGASLIPRVLGRGLFGAATSGAATGIGDIGAGKSDNQVMGDIARSATGGAILQQLNLPKGANLQDLRTTLLSKISPNIEKGIQDAAHSDRFGIGHGFGTTPFAQDNVNFARGNNFPVSFTPEGVNQESQNIKDFITNNSNDLNQYLSPVKVNANDVSDKLESILPAQGKQLNLNNPYNVGFDPRARDALNQFRTDSGGNLDSSPISLDKVNNLKQEFGTLRQLDSNGNIDYSHPNNQAYSYLKDFVEKNSPDNQAVKDLNAKIGQAIDIRGFHNRIQRVPQDMNEQAISSKVNDIASNKVDNLINAARYGTKNDTNNLINGLNLLNAPSTFALPHTAPLWNTLKSVLLSNKMNDQERNALINAISSEGGPQIPAYTTKMANPLLQFANRANTNLNTTPNNNLNITNDQNK